MCPASHADEEEFCHCKDVCPASHGMKKKNFVLVRVCAQLIMQMKKKNFVL